MSANEHEILQGMEPYRDPFQKLMGYQQDSDQYSQAQLELYEELSIDPDVGDMDQFHVLRMVTQGNPETSFNYLREQVLEE